MAVITRSQSKKQNKGVKVAVLTSLQSKKNRDKKYRVVYERNDDKKKIKKAKKSHQFISVIVISLLSMLYFMPELREHIESHRTFYAFSYCVLAQLVLSWHDLHKHILIYAILYLLHGYNMIAPLVHSLLIICEPLNDIQCCILFTLNVICTTYYMKELVKCFSLISIVLSVVYFISFSIDLHSNYAIGKSSYSSVD